MNHALNSHSICFCFNPHKHEKGDPSLSQKGRGKAEDGQHTQGWDDSTGPSWHCLHTQGWDDAASLRQNG